MSLSSPLLFPHILPINSSRPRRYPLPTALNLREGAMSPPTQARGFPRSLQEHSQPQLRQLLTDSSPRFPPPPPSSCLAETFLSQAWSAEPLISSQGTLQGSALAQLPSLGRHPQQTLFPCSLLPSQSHLSGTCLLPSLLDFY